MKRSRLLATLLAVLFLSAVGVGVVIGEDDTSTKQVAVSDEIVSTTTTVPRTTTTRASTTTTTAPTTTTTTAAPTTTTAPRVTTTVPVATTSPAPTTPPPTAPPTTPAPTTPPTTVLNYDPIQCAQINNAYRLPGRSYDDPTRIPALKLANCPPHYWE